MWLFGLALGSDADAVCGLTRKVIRTDAFTTAALSRMTSFLVSAYACRFGMVGNGRQREHGVGRGRRRQGPQGPQGGATDNKQQALPDDKSPPEPRGRRFRRGLIAILSASGVLATAATIVITANYDRWVGEIEDWLGIDAIRVYAEPLDEPRMGPYHIWVVNGSLRDAPTPPTHDGVKALLQTRKAIRVGPVARWVTLENRRTETVRITRINAVLLQVNPPLSGAVVYAVEGGGQTDPPVDLAFDLDSENLDARSVDEKGIKPGNFLDNDKGLELEKNEKLRFRLTGHTRTSYVEWDVEVRFIVTGKVHTVRVADTHDIFRTTAPSRTYSELYRWAMKSGMTVATVQDLCQDSDCTRLGPR